jgi:hypothetical protein
MLRPALLFLLLLAACEPPPPHLRSVEDFLDEPAVLQGVVSRCSADPKAALRNPECETARIAVEHLAKVEEAKHVGEKSAQEEKSRDDILRRREAERRAQEAQSQTQKFDPYTSPVSEEPAPNPPPAQAPKP